MGGAGRALSVHHQRGTPPGRRGTQRRRCQQHATCACENNPTRCEGILGVHRLLTELDVTKNSHEMTMPEGEAAKVLGIAAAGAAGAISPQLEHVDASEMMESRDALLHTTGGSGYRCEAC